MSTSRLRRSLILLAASVAAFALAAATAGAAAAYANGVTYTGQGLTADGYGGYDLNTELCGVANGADVDGPYLLWVLTANKANHAAITISGVTYPMTQAGQGTYKYISGWLDPTTLPGHVYATYDGKATNAQLTISHGCRPYTHGAWCSPGFWKNADDAAWALTGHAKTEAFNQTVVPGFYDSAFTADPALYTTLTDITYKSGQLTSGPYGLTPFNATGAFLTNAIPGYQFDPSFMQTDDSQTCPIDSHGNFKTATG
jgi:hypothetical protein